MRLLGKSYGLEETGNERLKLRCGGLVRLRLTFFFFRHMVIE